MQAKKNPKLDLRKYSALFFVFGLALTLFIAWQILEWKTYERNLGDYQALNVSMEEEEEIPITQQTLPPPPPPPAAVAQVIEVVEDEEEVVEIVIESTEIDKEEIIEDVEVEEEVEAIDVPFAIIEDVPIFPGCEGVPKSQRRDCFQEKINKHVHKNFRYLEIAQDLGIQGKVFVQFVIEKDGKLVVFKCAAPTKP